MSNKKKSMWDATVKNQSALKCTVSALEAVESAKIAAALAVWIILRDDMKGK